MFGVETSGDDIGAIIRHVEAMSRPNLQPLAETLRGIMIRDNREGLLAGTDGAGAAMEAVKESTIRRGRGGDGEPLNPKGDASRAILDYGVQIDDIPGGKRLTGQWPNSPFIRFHVTGSPRNNMPARNPLGIRPDGQAQIRQELDDFASSLIGRRSSPGR